MKLARFYLACSATCVAILQAQSAQPPAQPPPAPAPPPVLRATAPAAPAETYVYEQKAFAGRSYLVTPEQAQSIINRFKEAYPKMGKPRVLIYVNRELIDENAGMKLSARKVQTESVRGGVALKANGSDAAAAAKNATATNPVAPSTSAAPSERVTAQNTYRFQEPKSPTLADKQTVRDIERLIGRPLRLAGVALVDQQIASHALPGKPLETFHTATESEQARRDREALSKVADVVLEVLMSSRNVTVAEISGDKSYSVPDLQATAIRLSDARIIGQATASDIIGGAGARLTRAYDVREVTEATALSLMEDIMMAQ